MKFVGWGSDALHKLKKYRGYQKPTKIKNRTTKPKTMSKWEYKIHTKIDRAIDCEDSRIFPLYDGTVYRSDYILTRMRNGKKIIVILGEHPTSSRMHTYRSFMKKFKTAYYVIIIVKDSDLRTWNKNNLSRRILFDEIWVDDDIAYMIKSIKKSQDAEYLNTICNSCNKRVQNITMLKRDFIYSTKKDGSLAVEPLCRKCLKNKSFKPKLFVTRPAKCVGCGASFNATEASQLYCNICLAKA